MEQDMQTHNWLAFCCTLDGIPLHSKGLLHAFLAAHHVFFQYLTLVTGLVLGLVPTKPNTSL
eukprot:1647411-Amphidinium_carterae.1